MAKRQNLAMYQEKPEMEAEEAASIYFYKIDLVYFKNWAEIHQCPQ
jgi:hypothetical protein